MAEHEPIHCQHDGDRLEGLIARPATIRDGIVRHPTVLVMHSALGLRHQVRGTIDRLAARNYLAIATDMYGPDIHARGGDAPGLAYGALHETPERLRARVVAWFDTVAARDDVDPHRIAAIGYCFGGHCVLELARSGAKVRAVVSYHGTLTTHAPARPGEVHGEVVAYCGAKDPYAPLAHVDALRAELAGAGARYNLSVFGEAEHGFTDPDAAAIGMPGIAYNAIADRVSWAGTLALLEHVLPD